MTQIAIQFTRFSAFYSPLILTIAGGYLKEEGLEAAHSISPPGQSAIAALRDGTAHVVQSAPSQAFAALEKGEPPPVVHFAQVNEMDGFFLTGRVPEPEFDWAGLAGRDVLVDHGAQPLTMFQYACHKRGVDFARIGVIDAGGTDAMDKAFRAGQGEYIHQQGPAPQQLAHEGIGHIVAAVGEAIGPCAFSSLAATREWLESDMAAAFTRAYRAARRALLDMPAGEVARLEAPFFPEVEQDVLAATIARYQALGNWTPHIEITEAAWAATVDIFLYAGRITKRHPYREAIASPPEG